MTTHARAPTQAHTQTHRRTDTQTHTHTHALVLTSTIMPAPSPITNPVRPAENGRDAWSGLPLH